MICDALTKLETPEDHIIRLPISAPDRLDLESKSEEAQAVEEQLKKLEHTRVTLYCSDVAPDRKVFYCFHIKRLFIFYRLEATRNQEIAKALTPPCANCKGVARKYPWDPTFFNEGVPQLASSIITRIPR